jgi:hypothetical protein
MIRVAWALALIGAAAAAGAATAQADPPDAAPPAATALVERAIEFHGGRAALSDWPSLELKGQLELTGRAAGRSAEFVGRERGDGAYRRETTFDFRGSKITTTEIFDRSTCKRRFRSGWDALPLDEAREEAEHRVPFLLQAAERKPTVVGPGTEGETVVWYVDVPDGRGTARLGLAQDDGRLVSLEFPGTKAEGLGVKEDVTKRVVFRDPRPVGRVRLAFDEERFSDGTPDGRLRLASVTVLPAFDSAWLAVPEAADRFVPSEELAY